MALTSAPAALDPGVYPGAVTAIRTVWALYCSLADWLAWRPFVFHPIAPPPQVEHGKARFIADNHLAVDQARTSLER